MSELKAFNCVDSDVQEFCEQRLVYLKSEADKVIEELKAQKAQAEDDCAYWKMREGNAVNAMHETEEYAMQLYRSDRHQKYKRCMAMARIAQDDWHLHNSFYALGHQEFEKRKCTFYEKWHKRWHDLAEKFKEADK